MRNYLLILIGVFFACCSSDNVILAEPTSDSKIVKDTKETSTTMTINITIGNVTNEIKLVDNVATKALFTKLREGPITLSPTANEYINGQPGDVVLYSGSNICIFYGTNSYSYTRLGKINGLSADELKTFLKGGHNNITVKLSLP